MVSVHRENGSIRTEIGRVNDHRALVSSKEGGNGHPHVSECVMKIALQIQHISTELPNRHFGMMRHSFWSENQLVQPNGENAPAVSTGEIAVWPVAIWAEGSVVIGTDRRSFAEIKEEELEEVFVLFRK